MRTFCFFRGEDVQLRHGHGGWYAILPITDPLIQALDTVIFDGAPFRAHDSEVSNDRQYLFMTANEVHGE